MGNDELHPKKRVAPRASLPSLMPLTICFETTPAFGGIGKAANWSIFHMASRGTVWEGAAHVPGTFLETALKDLPEYRWMISVRVLQP